MVTPVVNKTDRRVGQTNLMLWILTVLVSVLLLAPVGSQASGAPLVTWDTLLPMGAADQSTAPAGAKLTPEQLTEAAPISGHSARESVDLQMQDNWRPEHYRVPAAIVDQSVLIDGYVLPLAWEGVRVVEFLLVPWVGACIHMPSPPPNQIIRVSYPEGLVLDKQFEAVRLRGVLQHVPAQYDLFLIDGQREISVSYKLADAEPAGTPGRIVAMSAADLPKLAQLQLWITALFTGSMEAVADDGTSTALIVALLISFAYGALHTLGPGHGKSVVISYFVGTGGSMRRGVLMGAQIAVVHVLSAILVVFVLDLAVRQFTGAAPADYWVIRLGSYALIMVIGAIMLWQAVRAWTARRQTSVASDPVHADHHHHHDHHHGHAHTHDDHAHSGCAACRTAAHSQGSGWIAASVGVVPCTGAILVMLFGLANDLVWPAIFMVACISLGMAVAMSVIGVIALYGRQVAQRRFAGQAGGSLDFDLGARLTGSACVLAIGALLFAVTLAYPPVLQVPINALSASQIEPVSAGG